MKHDHQLPHMMPNKKPAKGRCKEHSKDQCDDCLKEMHRKCDDDCLCKFLKEFIGKTFDFRTKSGNFITGKIECITKDCCISIIESDILTSHIQKK